MNNQSETICKLCHENKNLCKSHIIPEFMYKNVYSKKIHNYIMISTDIEKRNIQRPTGIYERLFCKDCENILSEYENYAYDVLTNEKKYIIERISKKKLIVKDIDYKKFRQFQLSLLWRFSVSQRPEFSKVSLGPHSEKIRNIIWKEQDIEPYQYGCWMVITPKYFDIMSKMIELPSEIDKIENHRMYRFMGMGIWWNFFVSSHTETIPYKELIFLSKGGSLPIFLEDKYSENYFLQLVNEWKVKGKIPDKISQ